MAGQTGWEIIKEGWERYQEIERINKEREAQGLEPLPYAPENENESKPLDWVDGLIMMVAGFVLLFCMIAVPFLFLIVALVWAMLTYKS